MAEQKIIGLFSVGRDGEHCLHEGEATKEEAERIRKLLNTSVTGGPYKMFLAIASPIDGVLGTSPDQQKGGDGGGEDDFKTAVLRCRYPVCKSIHPSGWGWATSRLNEVVADHGGELVDTEAAYKHDRAYTDGMAFARQCIGAPTTMERADEALRKLDTLIQRRHAQEAEYRAERRATRLSADQQEKA